MRAINFADMQKIDLNRHDFSEAFMATLAIWNDNSTGAKYQTNDTHFSIKPKDDEVCESDTKEGDNHIRSNNNDVKPYGEVPGGLLCYM